MRATASTFRFEKESGFTLIELSIVLVIIGLIVGGILVGQDMIKAAEIRGTISQIQKYDSAVNTFRTKYGYVPGDVPSTTAGNLGFFAVTSASANLQGYGDGNGLIEYCGGNTTFNTECGEPMIFWRHLTDASLVDGNFGTTTSGSAVLAAMTGGAGVIGTALTSGTVYENFPPAKLGRGNYIALYSASGANYFQITGITGVSTAGALTLTTQLTPLEAYTIDLKIDDGLPQSGSVQAMSSTTTLNTAAPTGAGLCVTGTNLYDTVTNGPSNTMLCQLGIRFN